MKTAINGFRPDFFAASTAFYDASSLFESQNPPEKSKLDTVEDRIKANETTTTIFFFHEMKHRSLGVPGYLMIIWEVHHEQTQILWNSDITKRSSAAFLYTSSEALMSISKVQANTKRATSKRGKTAVSSTLEECLSESARNVKINFN
ncbi:hypothetical protein QE152_g34371 [Popillia japonica]|uniref:Uncharacterized protein n=1 Tax=Popillia japonica TaxID=7064 RepID=A0AAW1IU78_POPJA